MTTFTDIDPATGESIAEIEATSAAQLQAAIERARAAQGAWAALGIEERCACLALGLQRLQAVAGPLAEEITREMGKPLADAKREVAGWKSYGPELLAEIQAALAPEILESDDCRTELVREAHGVVAAITPWNFPVHMPLEILVPALAAGNSVVFKPSELVPLTGKWIADSLGAALPEGVLELVQGGGDVGARLVAGEVDMIGFVGSRDTGVAIMQSAAGGLKRLVLELGGKDPMLVFADADLEAAAECATRHSLRNTGQVCCSVERVYVAREVAARFEELVLERAREWREGPGLDAQSKMGPLVNEQQRARVMRHVQDAVKRGARLLLGGRDPEGGGYFYPATVLADVSAEMDLSKEETFGPVVALTSFSGDEDEAVQLANDTPYGLGANVWSGDVERGKRVARRIQSGQVGVNRYLGSAPGAPWVGARQSGFGFLGGVDGHRQFTLPKSISTPI